MGKETSGPRVAVLGATGLVGRMMLACLEERGFAVGELVPLASERSIGACLRFRGIEHAVELARPEAFAGVDLVLASAGAGVSRSLLPAALEYGASCVDNSSAFRLDPGVPLIVPEVNGARLAARPRLVANPNCSTIQLVCALAPLQRAFGLRRVQVATYQSLSGAGSAALETLDGPSAALDVVPLIGELDDAHRSEEEAKLANETRKILELEIPVEALCVRVPTRVGHGEAVWIECERPPALEEALAVLSAAPGVRCDGSRGFASARDVAGSDAVRVGRLRTAGTHGLIFWVAADNLRKGAALNAVQIAEALLGG